MGSFLSACASLLVEPPLKRQRFFLCPAQGERRAVGSHPTRVPVGHTRVQPLVLSAGGCTHAHTHMRTRTQAHTQTQTRASRLIVKSIERK